MLNDKQWEFIKNQCANSEVEQYVFEGDWGNWNWLLHELQRLAWRPIDEAPKDGTHILAYMGKCPYLGVDLYRAGMIVDGDFMSAANAYEFPMKCSEIYKWVTHWMPLPPTPKEGE